MDWKGEIHRQPITATGTILLVILTVLLVILTVFLLCGPFLVARFRNLPDDYFVAAGYALWIAGLIGLYCLLQSFFPVTIRRSNSGACCEWEGRLVRSTSQNEPQVYFVLNSRRYPIFNWETPAAIGLGRDDLYFIPKPQLEAIPLVNREISTPEAMKRLCNEFDAPKIVVPSKFEGMLIKADPRPHIYLVRHGQRHHLIRWDYASPLGLGPENVRHISEEELDAIPNGIDIDSAKLMHKLWNSGPQHR